MRRVAVSLAVVSTLSAYALSQRPAVAAGPFRDGQFKGSVADAYFGPLQVTAVIANGQLVDVQIVE